MPITFDPAKREINLEKHGLDFSEAEPIFDGTTFTLRDDRKDYGEARYQSYGMLAGRLVTLAWTWRGEARHIISMRKCNERERTRFTSRLG